MNKTSIKNWYQIEIEVDACTSGKELTDLLVFLGSKIKTKYMVLDYITGAVDDYLYTATYPMIMAFKQFLNIARPATQFDWAYLYLFEKKENAECFVKQMKLIEPPFPEYFNKLAEYFRTLVVVFDDTSFIIYTQNKSLKDMIKTKYINATIKERTIDQLEFYL